jgi:precorrin-2 dehydrogenase/sirohydrochlorin ferrochelatase
MHRYIPIFLDIQGKNCVVFGGGEVAFRKVRTLLEHGAKVKVVSTKFCSGLQNLVSQKKIDCLEKEYDSDDLDGAFVVFAATSDKDMNAKIFSDARRQDILINVVDNPRMSDFISPSCLYRGNLCIAVSTSGKSPALARKIRTDLENKFDSCYAELVNLIEEVRSDLKQRQIVLKNENWQKALDLDTLVELLAEGHRDEAMIFIKNRLEKLDRTTK